MGRHDFDASVVSGGGGSHQKKKSPRERTHQSTLSRLRKK
jgi:hypothetical protein